jgi:hypothetical protein
MQILYSAVLASLDAASTTCIPYKYYLYCTVLVEGRGRDYFCCRASEIYCTQEKEMWAFRN